MKEKEIEALKTLFEEKMGFDNLELTNEDVFKILNEIKLVPPEERTDSTIIGIVGSIGGIESRALDNGDIDDVIGQIGDILKQRKL